jgi:hypothetical protein
MSQTQGEKGAKISRPSSILGSGCKMEKFCSGTPPSYNHLSREAQYPVQHRPAG